MRIILKNIFITLLAIVLIIGSVVPCFAAEQSGKITVTLEDKEKNHINGVKVYLCQVAELNDSGYYPTTAFETSGISVSAIVNNPDETAAKTIFDYIKEKNVSTLSKVSTDGKASFSDLNLGIWVVLCEENGKHTFNPYIVFLPYESKGNLHYEVSSTPKVEDSDSDKISIYVIKKWDDKNNAAKKRPDSVFVELLNGNTAVSSIELSEANGWAHTFTNVSKDGVYSVKEKSVSNYKATYSGDLANGFVVTNSYNGEKLPQTGQYWWPIVIIAIAGAGFILLGIYEIGVKKNGKK